MAMYTFIYKDVMYKVRKSSPTLLWITALLKVLQPRYQYEIPYFLLFLKSRIFKNVWLKAAHVHAITNLQLYNRKLPKFVNNFKRTHRGITQTTLDR